MHPAAKRVLEQSSFGSPVAEYEAERLAHYFVETEQWRELLADEIDIIFGAKGSGKSTLYSLQARPADRVGSRLRAGGLGATTHINQMRGFRFVLDTPDFEVAAPASIARTLIGKVTTGL